MKIFKTYTLPFAFILLLSTTTQAQDKPIKVFRDTRIVNGHSVEMSPKGTMKFIISHRFGAVNTGAEQLWGLDISRIRIGLDYAPMKKLNIGFGRSSEQKNYDFFAKYVLLSQNKASTVPVSLSFFTEASLVTSQALTEGLDFLNKLSYTYQFLIARKLHDRVSLQLMPTLVHRNFVSDQVSDNDLYSLGAAGRFQISKQIAFNLEYFYVLPDQLGPDLLGNQRQDAVGLGIEIETKGHIFQLNLTNSQDFVAPFYIGETVGEVGNGDIHFGFNITRDFKVSHRRYK
ncbi:MAG: DUF5777 family beta-barrel protein [Bacteroidota bacterium]